MLQKPLNFLQTPLKDGFLPPSPTLQVSLQYPQAKLREKNGPLEVRKLTTTRPISLQPRVARQFDLLTPLVKEFPSVLKQPARIEEKCDLSLPDMAKITHCQNTKEVSNKRPSGWEKRANFFRTMSSSNEK